MIVAGTVPMRAIVGIALCLLAVPAIGQTIPDALRPRSAKEVRALDDTIVRLQRDNHLQRRTIESIVALVGAATPAPTFPALIQRVNARVVEAAALRTQIDMLRKELAGIAASAVRDPAQASRARAQIAFDEGRFQDADRELAALEILRNSDLAEGQKAWLDAVMARARLAEIRLDFDLSTKLQNDAADQAEKIANIQLFDLRSGAAKAQYFKGERKGDNAALLVALQMYQDRVLPIALRLETRHEWAVTKSNIGLTLSNLGARESGTARLQEAIGLLQESLDAESREKWPLFWAATQNTLGSVLSDIGDRTGGTPYYEKSIAAYQLALQERRREVDPLLWAATQNNLGISLASLGENETGDARLVAAVAAYQSALKEVSEEKAPLTWATTQSNLGNALQQLAFRHGDAAMLEQAVQAYRASLRVRTREQLPLQWAAAQVNLANTYSVRDLLTRQPGSSADVIATYREALTELTRERDATGWATVEINLGQALYRKGDHERDAGVLGDAISTFRAAAEVFTRADAPRQWSLVMNNLGNAQFSVGMLETGRDTLDLAVKSFDSALLERPRATAAQDWAETLLNRCRALVAIAERTGDKRLLNGMASDAKAAAAVVAESGESAAIAASQKALADIDRVTAKLGGR